MALMDDEKLRALLGEPIPEDGTDKDTLFLNVEIEQLLESNPNLDRAAFEGWRIKAARYSSLVDTTEGNTQRKFSQLLANAHTMMKVYERDRSGPTEGRARVGRIIRPGVEW